MIHNNDNITDAQLLTEEWMMGERSNHEKKMDTPNRSLLPSFIEVMFMEETDRYISTTLRTIIIDVIHRKFIQQILLERLVRYQQNIQQSQTIDNNNAIDSSDHDTYNVVSSSSSLSSTSSSLSNITMKVRSYLCYYIILYWKKLKHYLKHVNKYVLNTLIFITRNMDHILHHYTLEVYYILRYILERQSLLHSSSTIAESLYGLIRVKNMITTKTDIKKSGTKIQLLNKKDRIRVALLHAIGPYIIEKIQQQYDHFNITQSQHEMNPLSISSSRTITANPIQIPIIANTIISKVQTHIQKIQSYIQHVIYDQYNIQQYQQHLHSNIIRFIYPLILSLYKGFNVYYRWQYLINLSHYININNRLLSNILLRRQQQQQQQSIENKSSTDNNNNNTPTAGAVSNSTNITTSMFQSLFMKKGLSFVIATPFVLSYCTQMVHWYYEIRRDLLLRQQQQQQQNNYQYDINHHTQNENQIMVQSPGVIPVPIFPINNIRTSKDSCPICGQSFHKDNDSNGNIAKSNQSPSLVGHSTPAAATKSIVALNGYMYCSYSCIVAFLREHNNICPITGKTVIDETKQVVRLLI